MTAPLPQGPHQGQPLVWAGRRPEEAKAAMVMVHGRGATAESILELREEWGYPELAYVAPQAAGFSWYPNRFLSPLASNEPWLSSALTRLGETLAELAAAGLPPSAPSSSAFPRGPASPPSSPPATRAATAASPPSRER